MVPTARQELYHATISNKLSPISEGDYSLKKKKKKEEEKKFTKDS